VGNGIYQHGRPDAVFISQDVDGSVIALDLPEMFQVDSQNTADKNHVYAAVRADKNRLAGIFGNGVFESVTRTIFQVAQIFTVGKFHKPRTIHPKFVFYWETRLAFFGRETGEVAIIDFFKAVVGVSDGFALSFVVT